MRGNPGTLAIMADGRKVIIYNKQPLLEAKGKVVVHLINDDFELIKEGGISKTLLFSIEEYNEKIKSWKAIGKCD